MEEKLVPPHDHNSDTPLLRSLIPTLSSGGSTHGVTRVPW
jgi:hypothetical protein